MTEARSKKDEIILRDLEETEEIIFVLKGEVKNGTTQFFYSSLSATR